MTQGGLRQGEDLRLDIGPVALYANVALPAEPRGLVVFAHGSGSGRHSPRNNFVAESLRSRGLGTVLSDLLTTEEEIEDAVTRAYRFDIELLARRLVAVTEWLGLQQSDLPAIGYFGASTGAAAALIAASRLPDRIAAIVSRGGRPDLAGPALSVVEAPCLFIVGGRDETVLDLNREAMRRLPSPKSLRIVPGATHLFEEPGALKQVATLAGDWFLEHL